MIPTSLPSPTVGVLQIGPLAIHAYALCILIGIAAAVAIAQRRLADRGGREGAVLDVALWAVPFGIIGGRLYHVITTPQPYFGEGGNPLDALKIWNGGLGIWGAIAMGALGAYIACRRYDIPFLALADSAAPGIAVAQAIGRWGNWFNNEIYGEPTDLPWGLVIHQFSGGRAVLDAEGQPIVLGTFHPTFLYESIFCLLLAIALLLLDRYRNLAPGQVLGAYVAGYPLGRIILETMRTDHANEILGLRVNIWTSVLVFILGLAIWVYCGRRAKRPTSGPTTPSHPASVSDSEKVATTT